MYDVRGLMTRSANKSSHSVLFENSIVEGSMVLTLKNVRRCLLNACLTWCQARWPRL